MESFRLRPNAADEAENISYWRALLPSLNIEGQVPSILPDLSLSRSFNDAKAVQLLRAKGYLQTDTFLSSEKL